MMISTHALAVLIGLIYPAYLMLTYKKTYKRMRNDVNYKLVDYKQTIFIFWLLALLIIANAFYDKSFQLNFHPTFNTVGIILAPLIFLFIGLQIAAYRVSTMEKAESIIEKMGDNYQYLPKSKQEFIWFNLLSLSAGICEEIIFRVFAFSYLIELSNVGAAFIVTNAIFALTHIGSSKQNIISALLLGLLFSTIYYFTGNIWLAVILHSAIDISSGILGYSAHAYQRRTANEVGKN